MGAFRQRVRPFAVAAAAAVVAAACSSGGGTSVDAADTSGPSTSAATTVAPGDTAPPDTTAAPPSGDPGGSDGSDGQAQGTPAPPTTAAGDPAGQGGDAPPPAAAAAYPHVPPGDYTYDQTGEIRAGPTTQPADPVAVDRYFPPEGADQRNTSVEDGEEMGETVYRHLPEGVFLVRTVRKTPDGRTIEFRPDPPVVVAPAGLAPGDSWSWTMTSTDGSFTLEQTTTVLRTETVDVGGTGVQTVVLDTDVTLTSDELTMRADTTQWVSPAHSLEVRSESHVEGTFGAIPFTGDVTRTLRSLQPS